jgi:hypothetical protein
MSQSRYHTQTSMLEWDSNPRSQWTRQCSCCAPRRKSWERWHRDFTRPCNWSISADIFVWKCCIEGSSFIHSFIRSSMALQYFVGPGLFFSFVIFFTQSVGLLGQEISPSQGRYLHTGQHKQNKRTQRHPCLEWDSNPRSQCSSERRQFMP